MSEGKRASSPHPVDVCCYGIRSDDMSVIAWDGTTMAADKQSNDAGLKRTTTKIKRLPNGDLIGSVGDSATAWLMERWFQDGADVATFPDKERKVNTLVITTDGRGLMFDRGPLPDVLEDPFTAFGSGRGLAIGAMAAGKSAAEAVQIACDHDDGCGRGIDVLDLVVLKEGDTPCSNCGRRMTGEEIEHYITTCNRCEGLAMGRWEHA